MNNNPLVSIIIPTYNRLHIISKTLESVKKQSYLNWECIVVDDGSTDTTDQLLEQYCIEDSRFQFYKRPVERIKGAPTCRNIGLEKSKGVYIIFLDSDDFLLAHCLSRRVQYFTEDKKSKFLIFPMAIIENCITKKKEIKAQINYLDEFLKHNNPWQTMCPIWDANFIKDLQGFKEGYPRLNDPELHIRAIIMAKGSFKVHHAEIEDCVYLGSGDIITIDFANRYLASLQIFVPDIVAFLKAHNIKKQNYLINYFFVHVHLYFDNTEFNQLRRLLLIFKRNNVISSMKYIYYLFLIFILKSIQYLIHLLNAKMSFMKSVFFK